MPALWRLTRNRYGRAVYDALARVGVTATRMIEYVRPLGGAAGLPDARSTSGDVGVVAPTAVADADAPVGELRDGEDVVAVRADGVTRGYLFCSVDATHRVHPLETERAFDGAYLRRVFVAPDSRRRGVADGRAVRARCPRLRRRAPTRRCGFTGRPATPTDERT